MRNRVTAIFREKFGCEGQLYASAGRINLIGEHTDYNGGFVFPGAVDCGIVVMIRPNDTGRVRAWAIDFDDSAEFGLGEDEAPARSWARYIFGVCREIIKRGGRIGGFDAAFSGNVPAGAGMSSSAALESAFVFALDDLFGLGLDKFEMARIGQATEHNYLGVMCGIMDQFASIFGRRGHLMRLDCRSMEYRYYPFSPEEHGYRVVLLDSVVKHKLVDSPYNRRRESCERAAAAMGVGLLRDATFGMLEGVRDRISAEDYRRARFVIGEVQRVLDVCAALEAGDYATVGERMYQTHEGLSKDYEVSCEELDFLVDTARACGVTGSRIMGGGFGGCTINLVREELCERFTATARERFAARYGHEPRVYDVVISDGARKL